MILIIATRNRHKTEEIKAILGPDHQYMTLADFPDSPHVIEDADTFEGNARKKAVELADWIQSHPEASGRLPGGMPALVLADDSGLEVDALGGAPGVQSARFAALDRPGQAGNAADADNNAKLLRLLEEIPEGERTARFRCVMVLQAVGADVPEVDPGLFQGVCEGRIGYVPHGSDGFGYDPLFIPDGYAETFAELGDSQKNRLSHRSHALDGVKAAVQRGRE